MLSFHTGTAGDPLILSLGLPAKFTLPARALLAVFFFAATGWALFSLARRSSFRAILAPLTLATTQFLWFLLPALVELFNGREVPQTRYSKRHSRGASFGAISVDHQLLSKTRNPGGR